MCLLHLPCQIAFSAYLMRPRVAAETVWVLLFEGSSSKFFLALEPMSLCAVATFTLSIHSVTAILVRQVFQEDKAYKAPSKAF